MGALPGDRGTASLRLPMAVGGSCVVMKRVTSIGRRSNLVTVGDE